MNDGPEANSGGAASGDIRETQRFLDHAQLERSIYLQQLTGENDQVGTLAASSLACLIDPDSTIGLPAHGAI